MIPKHWATSREPSNRSQVKWPCWSALGAEHRRFVAAKNKLQFNQKPVSVLLAVAELFVPVLGLHARWCGGHRVYRKLSTSIKSLPWFSNSV